MSWEELRKIPDNFVILILCAKCEGIQPTKYGTLKRLKLRVREEDKNVCIDCLRKKYE